MTRSRPSGRTWKSLPTLIPKRRLGLAFIAIATVSDCRATGFYGPSVYLDQGGKNVNASPEFYWELEAKRLAKGLAPGEKLITAPASNRQAETEDAADDSRSLMTTDVDVKDFAAALQDGRIKPENPEKATDLHKAARELLTKVDAKTTDTLPEEFASEFADYHRGALAYRLKDWDKARKAWEELLSRPAGERHYRTVWAAFMLGKVALKTGSAEAVQWFQRTRDLAREGFADSLGMAADSYGWEGRSEWKQNHPDKAAKLFLIQLALGDESAIVSLKALIPDREPIEGMLNYGPESEERQGWSAEQKKADEQKTLFDLKTAAKDPLLRRLVTAHILATESSAALSEEESWAETPRVSRCSRWLSVIKEAHLDQFEDAEYLGWVAYTNGKYQDAAHWLDLAKSDTPAACWLRAKLQRRAGKLEDAAHSMAKAWQSMQPIETYTGWAGVSGQGEDEVHREGGSWSFVESASGDLGALDLERATFTPAIDVLRKGGLFDDMAFVAERVLTADELKAYVDQLPVQSGTPDSTDKDSTGKLRYLLGRRLVREDRYAEAAHYLAAPYDRVLDEYVKALKGGADEKRPRLERARAWFTAAWIARYDGMEIMGTEGFPDGFSFGGDFELPDLAKQRQSGVYQITQYKDGKEKTTTAPIVVKTTKPELQRLTKNKISPDVRFHYRVIAGALAMRAAGFLEDNSAELADVVNTAGLWVKDRDEKTGDRYYQVLEKRCAQTEIGRAAIAKHWFVDESGPWSAEQQAAHEKLHKELGLQN
ncbi:MAG TPA: tetratricopeptide repeat protein [Chthoniobacterales bacterium]|nr:tetratricopeptide repeat protein [Chthoniobacterales bacterium]